MIKNSTIASFEDRVDDMVQARPIPSMADRFTAIAEINEEFFGLTGHNLPAQLLSRMSDWVLIEILNDKDVDKVSNSEFAILSPRQLKRRDKRENSVEGGVMDYLNQKFVKNKDSLSKKVKKDSDY